MGRHRRLVVLVLASGALVGCRAGDLAGNAAGAATGNARIGNMLRAIPGSPTDEVAQMNVAFTPEQEYRLGRLVAATAIARYGLDPDAARQEYVRTVGQTIVRLADRLTPTYGGYTFGVLNTDEVNGVSGPGGFVLVTRGAVRAAKTEDELAGILAHEMAHSSLKHGEAAMRARSDSALRTGVGVLARLAAGAAGGNDQGYASGKTAFFGKMAEEATTNALEHNYGGNAEFDADEEAVYLLWQAGYDASAVESMLRHVAELPGAHGGAAHADPRARADRLVQVSATYGHRVDPAGVAARAARFKP